MDKGYKRLWSKKRAVNSSSRYKKMPGYLIKISILLVVMLFFMNIGSSFAEEAEKKPQTKKAKRSLTMEETKVKGDVEKPEFINIIKRRRIEFEDKGEFNTSFTDIIYSPLIRHQFENNFLHKVNQLLDRGSINK